MRSAETSLALADNAYASTLTRAPFSGVIAKVMVEQGEVLSPGGAVARLVQLDPALVSVTVSDRDVVSLEPGLDVLVTTAAGASGVDAKIARISPVADTNTRAFRVEIDIPNAQRTLLPGMIVTVSLSVQLEPNLLSIPQYVLVTKRDGNGVFVLQDGVARWRAVELGRVVRDRVIIRSGVKVSEDVIVTGHRELADGDRVIVARKGTCCTRGRVDFGDDR